jgi:hypothetical protein
MVMYGLEPPMTLDLLALPLHKRTNMDVTKCADAMKKLHEETRETTEQQVLRHTTRFNTKKNEMIFMEGDILWIHLSKDHFPQEHNSKLKP